MCCYSQTPFIGGMGVTKRWTFEIIIIIAYEGRLPWNKTIMELNYHGIKPSWN